MTRTVLRPPGPDEARPAACAALATCFVPPAPELLTRIRTSRTRLFAGADLPTRGTVDLLDMRTMTLLLGRPAPSRPHTFGAAPAPHGPIIGTRRVLVLLVDFSDLAAGTPPTRQEELLFSAGTHPTGSLRDYYLEASHGRLTVGGAVSGNAGPTAGWYRAPQPKSFYTNGNFGWGSYPNNSQRLVEDLVMRAGPYVDFGAYDNDGDGVVDALVVLSAGVGGEVSGDSNDIWSHSWCLPAPIHVDGVAVSGYFIAPEDVRLGVLAHELGHSLMHWPDLYDTDYASAGTGRWDLMATGAWNGDGDRPAHPSGYCKVQAGWVTSTVVGGGTHSVTVRPYAHRGDVFRLPVDPAGTEYFLVTNRQCTGFDDHLPGSGIIIEHVDESRSNNNNESRYLVDIEQCDGRRDLNLGGNNGDAADAYPVGGQASFTSATSPASVSNDGADTGIAVTGIAVAANDMTAVITVGGESGPPSVVGTWHLTVEWDDDGGAVPAATLDFEEDGTWSYPGGGGRWVQAGGTIMWNCTQAPGLMYTATLFAGAAGGAMGYATAAPNPGRGSFRLVRAEAMTEKADPPPGPDPVVGPVG